MPIDSYPWPGTVCMGLLHIYPASCTTGHSCKMGTWALCCSSISVCWFVPMAFKATVALACLVGKHHNCLSPQALYLSADFWPILPVITHCGKTRSRGTGKACFHLGPMWHLTSMFFSWTQTNPTYFFPILPCFKIIRFSVPCSCWQQRILCKKGGSANFLKAASEQLVDTRLVTIVSIVWPGCDLKSKQNHCSNLKGLLPKQKKQLQLTNTHSGYFKNYEVNSPWESAHCDYDINIAHSIMDQLLNSRTEKILKELKGTVEVTCLEANSIVHSKERFAIWETWQ